MLGASSESWSSQSPVGAEPTELERRCDKVLTALVCDSYTWGRAQEKQARLLDENREMLRKSAKVRAQTAAETSSSSRNIDACTSFLDSPSFAARGTNLIARPIAGSYETAYTRHFGFQGAHDQHLSSSLGKRNITPRSSLGKKDFKKLARSLKSAKFVTGNERYRAISQWGAEPSVERTDI